MSLKEDPRNDPREVISEESGKPIGDELLDPNKPGDEPHESDKEDDSTVAQTTDIARPRGGHLVLADPNAEGDWIDKMEEALFGPDRN